MLRSLALYSQEKEKKNPMIRAKHHKFCDSLERKHYQTGFSPTDENEPRQN